MRHHTENGMAGFQYLGSVALLSCQQKSVDTLHEMADMCSECSGDAVRGLDSPVRLTPVWMQIGESVLSPSEALCG
jgi:hypothetical protein